MSRTMPKQRPGKSETIVVTPRDFVKKVCAKLGIDEGFTIDLAASKNNAVCDEFISKAIDSLLPAVSWRGAIKPGRWGWLNPPYDYITPWVRKADFAKRKIVVLVPASVGSNWWRDYVHEKAWVLFLNGRISFLDKHLKPICGKNGKPTPYPKDLALLVYGLEPGYDIWDWRK